MTGDATSEAAIWGLRAVEGALTAGHPIARIYLSHQARGTGIEQIKQLARERGVRFDFVDVGQLGRMSGTRDHQEVVARVSPVSYADIDTLLQNLQEQSRVTFLALDRVQHAGNVGMAIRSAVGFGADAVLLPTRGGRMVNDEVVRASAGAVYRVPIVASTNLVRDLEACSEAGFWSYGLDAGATRTIHDIDWPARTLLVAGHESRGLRTLLRRKVDELVAIPMAGGIDSLNVSVAASIVLFERSRRLRG